MMNWIIVGATVTGKAHLAECQANQDAIFYQKNLNNLIINVSDGLGSRSFSGLGAKLACRVGCEFWQYQHSIQQLHQNWLHKLGNIPPVQAACTLLSAEISNYQAKLIQLGDGLILVRSKGKVHAMTPDRQYYLNQTDCLTNKFNECKWLQYTLPIVQKGDGVVMMTDGLSDDIEPYHYADFFHTIYQALAQRSPRNGKKWLKRELNNWPTPLNGDDKSLIAVFRSKI